MSSSSPAQAFIDRFERALINGRARWIADLNEFFRNYRFGNTSFDLYVRGRTRNRGLFLSRFFAWTALPDYRVSLFCVDVTQSGKLSLERIRRTIDASLQMSKANDLQWAWLVVISGQELSPEVVSFVSRYDRNELGLAAMSLKSAELVVNNTHVGRSIRKHLKIEKILETIGDGETS